MLSSDHNGLSAHNRIFDGIVRHEVGPQRYHPKNTVAGHLSFAFRNESIFLEQLAKLYSIDEVKTALGEWINREPTDVYIRRAGFLYEWLSGENLNVLDLTLTTRTGITDAFSVTGAISVTTMIAAISPIGDQTLQTRKI